MDMDELEKLRVEMDALKRNLDKQQIVNKDLMRTVMKQRASWLNNLVIGEIVLLPVLFIMFMAMCVVLHVSVWFAVALLVIGGIDTAFDWRTLRISPRLISTSSIMQLRRTLVKQKKQRFWQTVIGTVLAIIWLILFASAALHADGLAEEDHLINFGGAIGGVFGGIFGGIAVVWIYKKAQKTNDDILSDLDEIEEE